MEASNTATFATSRVSACMLLLAPELLAIALCAGTAESELGPVDITIGVIFRKLYGAVRARAAV